MNFGVKLYYTPNIPVYKNMKNIPNEWLLKANFYCRQSL